MECRIGGGSGSGEMDFFWVSRPDCNGPTTSARGMELDASSPPPSNHLSPSPGGGGGAARGPPPTRRIMSTRAGMMRTLGNGVIELRKVKIQIGYSTGESRSYCRENI